MRAKERNIMNPELTALIQSTKESLLRMQGFDSAKLPRIEELGKAINFADAVDPANRLLDLYRQLSADVLEQLSSNALREVKSQADADFNVLNSILKFESGNPKQERDSRSIAVSSAYDPAFQTLHPYISYSVRKSTDFVRLEREARSLVQQVSDDTVKLQKELDEKKHEAERVLEAVRKVAEEQGVSQQAIYFKNEADTHETQSKTWLKATISLSAALALYAILTIFLHKWDFLAPKNAFETTQLAISKILIFATISYALILCSRNYLAHRHNCVVNRHRQNALVTYQAIVKAAGDEGNRDVVLAKAADCIFSAQATGYSKSDGSETGGGLSLVNVSPGAIKSTIGS